MAEKQILVLRLKAGVSIISTSTSTSTSTGIALPQPPTPPLGELERIGRSRDPLRNGEATVWKAEEEGGREGKGRRQAKVGGGGGGGWFQGKIGAADDEIG
uniref:Uncharacterized protein n=1 Tax=Vespula pensylvanica TaxID=30213 RepID=A0A834P0B8_VESPE|nr:hypothetical protein H0235_008570 [Vespula pensylvanica]